MIALQRGYSGDEAPILMLWLLWPFAPVCTPGSVPAIWTPGDALIGSAWASGCCCAEKMLPPAPPKSGVVGDARGDDTPEAACCWAVDAAASVGTGVAPG